jgi:hypothetical protein
VRNSRREFLSRESLRRAGLVYDVGTVKRVPKSFWMLGLVAGCLTGCNSSPQMSRIDSNRDVYEQWPIEVRQAVLDGKVEEGMTPDMVLMAIGKPTEVSTRGGTPQTGEDEVWIYRTGGETDPGMMYPGASYPGGGYPGTYPGGYPGGYPAGYPSGGYPGGYPGGSGGGIVMSPGRGVAVIPPSVGIGIGGGGIGIGGGGMGGGMGMPMPATRRPVEEREVVFRNGVVYRADPPPEPAK